jgi:hypothetical protein
VVPLPLGCLLAWTLVLAVCLFIFLSLSWVLSFYGVLQGFIIQKWKISYASNKMEESATFGLKSQLSTHNAGTLNP